MSTSQDEEITKLISVNAVLDLTLFAGAVHNEAAISTFEKSIEATSALPLDDIDDLWCQEHMFLKLTLIILNLCWVT